MKVVSLVLVLAMSLAISVPTFAQEKTKGTIDNNITSADVFSKEFPDAYIEQEFTPAAKISTQSNTSKKLLGTVKATVYVEEEYKNINGKKVCVSSRLLSKNQIDSIGKDKLGTISPSSVIVPSDSTSKGKLSLLLTLFSNNNTSHAIEFQPNGTARWTGFSDIGPNGASQGDDFVGFAWGGGFDYNSESMTATDNYDFPRDTYDADSTPNAGHVWGFSEGRSDSDSYDYVKSLGAGLSMFKNSLTGGGNTTSLIFKYIHTYQSASGSISISASPTGVGGGFSLTGVSKQWSLITKISSLKY